MVFLAQEDASSQLSLGLFGQSELCEEVHNTATSQMPSRFSSRKTANVGFSYTLFLSDFARDEGFRERKGAKKNDFLRERLIPDFK